MIGLALSIALAAAAVIVVTVIITQTFTDIAKMKYSYNTDMVEFTTDLGRVEAELVKIHTLVGESSFEKIEDIKLDITQLKMQAGL